DDTRCVDDRLTLAFGASGLEECHKSRRLLFSFAIVLDSPLLMVVLYRLVLMKTRSSPPMPYPGLSTRSQLLAGVVATPLFFGVGLAQAFSRPGFDLTRHFLSQLSAGEYGWLQMANFLVSGALYVICAMAMARTLSAGRAATWGPR